LSSQTKKVEIPRETKIKIQNIYILLAKKGPYAQKALTVALYYSNDTEDEVACKSLKIACDFVKNEITSKDDCDKVLQVAYDKSKHTTENICHWGLRLLTTLVKKHGLNNEDSYKTIANMAYTQSCNDDYTTDCLALLEAIVEKGYGFEESLNTACAHKSPSCSIWFMNAMKLFKALVEKGVGSSSALESALLCIIHPFDTVRDRSLQLIEAVLTKEKSFSGSIKKFIDDSENNMIKWECTNPEKLDVIKKLKVLLEKYN
jgi:hypothetical protein